ncbi:MAG: PilZ domain-containing protein [Sphingomonadaceae bacterium]|nr:PilZ domain-containing protein [Sphingomonadaceae bacterium]
MSDECAPEQRRAERRDVAIRAELREPGCTRFAVDVEDLSTSGFRCETYHVLPKGGRVFLHLPTFSPLEAHVAWKNGALYGFHFGQPLHVAVFETIAARFRPR